MLTTMRGIIVLVTLVAELVALLWLNIQFLRSSVKGWSRQATIRFLFRGSFRFTTDNDWKEECGISGEDLRLIRRVQFSIPFQVFALWAITVGISHLS
jgi:hypothetical protein